MAWGGLDPSAAQPTVYEPATNEWRLGRPAPLETRVGHVAVALAGRVLVWGGERHGKGFTDGAWYDPAADRWEHIAPAPVAKPHARAVVVGDQLVVFGGNVAGRDVNLLAYDLNEDRWDEPDVPFWPGSGSAVAALSDGRVAVWRGFERNPSDLAFLSASS